MMKYLNEKGLSIIELLAAISLLALIFTGAMYIYQHQFKAQELVIQSSHERINVQTLVSEMKHHIEQSSYLSEIEKNHLAVQVGNEIVFYEINQAGELVQTKAGVAKTLLEDANSLILMDSSLVQLSIEGQQDVISMNKRYLTVNVPFEEETEDDSPDEYDWSKPNYDYEITCLVGEFSYPKDTDFEEAVIRNDITCNQTNGVLSTKQRTYIPLALGSIKVNTHQFIIGNETTLHLTNGSLLTNAAIDISHQATLNVAHYLYSEKDITLKPSPSFLIAGKLYSNNLTLSSASEATINGPMKITNQLLLKPAASKIAATHLESDSLVIGSQSELTVMNDLVISRDVQLDASNSALTAKRLFTTHVTLNSNSKMLVEESVIANGNLIIKSSNSTIHTKNIQAQSILLHSGISLDIPGNLLVENDIVLENSNAKIQANDINTKSLYIKQSGQVNSQNQLNVRGELNVGNSAKITSGGPLIIQGDVLTAHGSSITAEDRMFVGGKLTIAQAHHLNVHNYLQTEGSIDLSSNIMFQIEGDLLTKGRITTVQDSSFTVTNHLFADSGLQITENVVATVGGDAYINSDVTFNSSWSQSTAFNIGGTLHYVNIVNDRSNSLIKTASRKPYTELNLSSYFHSIP
ncbi:hypothetical protein [Alkalihalobacillus trypoxylicola]|uniref:Prepilin-type N-terminal cleavage/methylation domain-containing protein n=1 Tax=Alkalihalobacillus trypoxylicola TaxID=519424 RepID=A0A161Q757_9BACI|nr:hypothetical protein [Alkalihalobacillus trypoxylicola]KYG32298.1 hypothetical protein AZF04_05905 [Alkalihalobacillus trypoxylicola]